MMGILEQHEDKWCVAPNGCYVWTGAVAGKAKDRPQIKVGGKMSLIGRLVCEEIYGPRPSLKHLALHDLKNGCVGGICVNGKHMRWGTQAENMQDIPSERRSDRIRLGWDRMSLEDRRKRLEPAQNARRK